jgi:hypothetical protein
MLPVDPERREPPHRQSERPPSLAPTPECLAKRSPDPGRPNVKARVRSAPISSPLPAKTSHLAATSHVAESAARRATGPRRPIPPRGRCLKLGRIYELNPAFAVARSIMTSAVGRPVVRSARTLRQRGPVRPRPASPLPGRLAGWRGRPRRRFPFARARPRTGSLAGFQR